LAKFGKKCGATYGTPGTITRILLVSSVEDDGHVLVAGGRQTSSGRKQTLDSSMPLVARNAFNFSALAGLVFWICVMGLLGAAASLAMES
jgi:hypothetical protein